MLKAISFFPLLVSLLSCGQNNLNEKLSLTRAKEHIQDSIADIQKSIEFIRQVKKRELNDTTFILSDKPFTFEYFECMEELLNDTSTYSQKEMAYIKQKKYLSLSKWTNECFPKIKLIRSEIIDSLFKNRLEGWSFFHNKIGHSFNIFSLPIFLRNYSYCIFYSDNHCGWLCGGGRLTLYKKINNKWEEFKSYCDWIS
jgi:hypothetical protein